jgi:hypothetical protein
MSALKEIIVHEVEDLKDCDLKQVADFISFLKYRIFTEPFTHWDESQIAELYSESAEEDRLLAESGLDDYSRRLKMEDLA